MFTTATEWVTRLADAHHSGQLQQELRRLGRYPLLAVGEVGYICLERTGARHTSGLPMKPASAAGEVASAIPGPDQADDDAADTSSGPGPRSSLRGRR